MLNLYIYIYIYIYTHTHTYIIYVYISFIYIGIPNELREITFGVRSGKIIGPLIETEKTFVEPLIASRSITYEKEQSSTLNKISLPKQYTRKQYNEIHDLDKELMQNK